MTSTVNKYTVAINPFNTGTQFYLEICVRLDHFIDIRKSLHVRRLMAKVFTILIPYMSF
ncbi:hypothetical protein E2C01_013573 [Portunus trituberculatus]|uniref:Uncharacterized protein n=1 Tax=Portunus trituberculatus TaxID=210409 RepID=A0A5B7DH06_PORTR|nr:hypothetical protein [Portunus trituberculatus]